MAFHTQRGSSLIMALVMLSLLSIVVISAFNVSGTNLKAVGNMQTRDESLAAANQAVEQFITSTFYNATTSQDFNIDINKDGTNDYTVTVAAPVCTRAIQVTEDAPCGDDVCTGGAAYWNTDWDIKATVTDSLTGASVAIRQGVRVKLTTDLKTSKCG